MKKKDKKKILIVGIIILIGIVAYFGLNNTYSFVKDGKWRFYEFDSGSPTSQYVPYTLRVKMSDDSVNYWSAEEKMYVTKHLDEVIHWHDYYDNYDESGNGINVEISSDVQYGKDFPATVTFNGLYGVFGGTTAHPVYPLNIEEKNVTVTCKATGKDDAECHVVADLIATNSPESGLFSPYGQVELIFSSNFLKQGIECLDNSYCSEGQTCSNSQCIIQETPKIYYQLSNNQCSEISLLDSMVASYSNVYSTLQECENNIVSDGGDGGQEVPKTNTGIIIVSIIGIILVIAFLIYLYRRR